MKHRVDFVRFTVYVIYNFLFVLIQWMHPKKDIRYYIISLEYGGKRLARLLNLKCLYLSKMPS